MRSLFTAGLLAAAAATLGGCGPVNQSVESVHQPVVSRTDFVFDAAGDAYGNLAPGETQRVTAWFDSIGVGYGDRIAIDGPYGRDAIGRIVADYGLLVSNDAPVLAGDVQPGRIRIVVSRSRAEVPGCPDWRRDAAPETMASTTSNYGCATNENLAAMIANPADLVIGQADMTGGDARTATKALRYYRDAEPTAKGGLKKESSGSSGGTQ